MDYGDNSENQRLTTTDETGHRISIHPEDVKGKWRDRRTITYWILIFIFLVLPWLSWNNEQVILLNISKREFIFFGNIFYANDAPLLVLIFTGFIFTMAFVTAIWGRAWCGWACPQTVFIDAIFMRIERMIEGRARRRMKLDSGPWTLEKLFKKSLKWTLFTIVSLHIAHSFMGYFVGTRELLLISLRPPSEHMDLFITMLTISGIFLFDFGWFREQFCLIACPYGRIQSVVMDDDSLIVAYDTKRGEPRKAKNLAVDQQGDCVDCTACVRACPTGIDIRLGTQLECIACTYCIDACDDIMERLDQPKGLIRFDTQNSLDGKPRKSFGLRAKVYLLIIIGILVSFIILVNQSMNLKAQFLRGKTVFRQTTLDNGEAGILNQYKLTMDYKFKDKKEVIFRLRDTRENKIKLITPVNPYKLKLGHQKVNMFFKFAPSILVNGAQKVHVQILDANNEDIIILDKEVSLVGPRK